jgi:glutaconyl-CoA decarboxylase
MRKFLINVNGSSYEVEVEEVKGETPAAVHAAPAAPRTAEYAQAAKPAASAPAPAPAPKVSPAASPSGSANVTSPMPGKILSINIKNGNTVKKGQVLCILEAMKMENDIVATADGTVFSVEVKEGDAVDAGQLLFVLN